MIRIGESDFLQAFDAMSEMALKDPVTVTKNGRDRLVVMSVEEYKRLCRPDGAVCGTAGAEPTESEAAPPARAAH